MYRAAARIEAAQGVEEVLGTGDLLPLVGESVEARPIRSHVRERVANGEVTETIHEGMLFEGGLSLQGNYAMMDTMLQSAMGSVSTSAVGALTQRVHTIGAMKTFTLGIDRRVSRWVYRECLTSNLAMNLVVGSVVSASVDLSAGDADEASTQNQALWLPPAGASDVPIRAQEMELRVKDFSASVPIAAGDAVSISGASLVIWWDVDTTPDRATQTRRRKPARINQTITGEFTLVRHVSDALYLDAVQGDEKMVDITITGPDVTGGGDFVKLVIRLGSVRISGGPVANGPNIIRQKFTFEAKKPSAVPAGFAGQNILEVVTIR